MPDEFLYLEVLPLRTAEEAGGFSRAAVRRRGVAVAATVSSSGVFRNFSGTESCWKLVEHLRSAKLVIGYNCLAFDYELIRGEVPFRRPKTTDLMLPIAEAACRALPLQKAAEIALGGVRVPSGQVTAELWRGGDRVKVWKSLGQRLTVLRKLHEFVAAEGFLVFASVADAVGATHDSADENALAARRSMLDRAAESFARTARTPRLIVVQNRGSGSAGVVSGGPDCENGMLRELGRTGQV